MTSKESNCGNYSIVQIAMHHIVLWTYLDVQAFKKKHGKYSITIIFVEKKNWFQHHITTRIVIKGLRYFLKEGNNYRNSVICVI